MCWSSGVVRRRKRRGNGGRRFNSESSKVDVSTCEIVWNSGWTGVGRLIGVVQHGVQVGIPERGERGKSNQIKRRNEAGFIPVFHLCWECWVDPLELLCRRDASGEGLKRRQKGTRNANIKEASELQRLEEGLRRKVESALVLHDSQDLNHSQSLVEDLNTDRMVSRMVSEDSEIFLNYGAHFTDSVSKHLEAWNVGALLVPKTAGDEVVDTFKEFVNDSGVRATIRLTRLAAAVLGGGRGLFGSQLAGDRTFVDNIAVFGHVRGRVIDG